MVILLDTNVLIDYFGQRVSFVEEVRQLKVASYFGDVDLWATANSFTDVYYVLSKGSSHTAIQEAFLASREFLSICSVTGEDIYGAAAEQWDDFEDALIVSCANQLKADYIVTRDARGFAGSNIKCLTPTELVDELKTRGVNYAEILLSDDMA
jgi:predicted nucleic acid-binding protein